jgi:hypothetical protein
MTKRILVLLIASASFFGSSAFAAMSPLSVSLVPPLEFPPSDFTVTGLRASVLWGSHRNVYGIDLGLIGNMTEGQMTGIAASGVFNYNRGSTTAIGLQAAGIANVNLNKARIYGVQVAAVNSNKAESVVVGLQAGLVNLASFTDIRGFQVGVYNKAHDVVGFQLGVINECDSLHGIQIGLLNFNAKGLFSVAPILNIGF